MVKQMNKIKIDKLVRSKRKSIALVISPEAMLVVRAPLMTPLKYIEDIVRKQKTWIDKKKRQILKDGPARTKQFVNGEEFLFLGEIYKLKIQDAWEIELKEDLIFPERFLNKARARMIAWYKERAFETITESAKHYSQISGWKYKTINITSAQGRWGSCSSSGSINFGWKLIMAPFDVVEYVVVHELAHITEKNHSSRFWHKVKTILPDYKTHEKWLKVNGKNLVL